MKFNRRTFILLGSFLLLVVTIFSPGIFMSSLALADGGVHHFLPAVRNDATETPLPTLTPTRTPTLTPEIQPDVLPLTSTSYYIKSLDQNDAYNLGCQLGTRDLKTPGKQDSVVVLAFAYPMKKNGVFGAYTYVKGIDFASVDTIADVAEWFGYGYWYCVGSDFESRLHVAIGTANHPAPAYSSVTYEHGQAWSRMVIDVDAWFTNGSGCPRGCDGQVTALGASDIELSWNSPTNSMNWVYGYASVPGLKGLVNFGALEGCPTFANPGAQCGNSTIGVWSRDQVLEVTAHGFIHVLPEIYLTNGVHAQQWYLMSKYAANSSKFRHPLYLMGPLTEYQACLQVGGCNYSTVGINNSPQQAWDQLYPLISDDPQTRVWMNYASDMKWQGAKDVPFPYSSPLPAAATPSAAWPKAMALPVPTNAPATDMLSLPSRIVDASKSLVHAWEGDIRNAWEGPYNSRYLSVLAGAAPDHPEQGLIIIDATDPSTGVTSRDFYPAATGTGPLRILSVNGSQVMLATLSGGTTRFDLNTRTYIP